jgi:hypothetical protein
MPYARLLALALHFHRGGGGVEWAVSGLYAAVRAKQSRHRRIRLSGHRQSRHRRAKQSCRHNKAISRVGGLCKAEPGGA